MLLWLPSKRDFRRYSARGDEPAVDVPKPQHNDQGPYNAETLMVIYGYILFYLGGGRNIYIHARMYGTNGDRVRYKNRYWKCLGKTKRKGKYNTKWKHANFIGGLLTMCFLYFNYNLYDLLVCSYRYKTRKSAVPAREQARLITCQPRNRDYPNEAWVVTITYRWNPNGNSKANHKEPKHNNTTYIPGRQSLLTLGIPNWLGGGE